MRGALDALYKGSGIAAAVTLVAMLVIILLGIIGHTFNFYIQGHDSYARYLLASTFFLGMVYTLRTGGHIRVVLLLDRLSEKARYFAEGLCLGGATAMAAYLAFVMVRLAWQSYELEDVSQATDATLLWIVQFPAACGAVLLAVAFF